MTEALFKENPHYVEYERLLVELHRLYGEGNEDSPEVEEVHEAMDAPESHLSRVEVARANGLSGDLYQLQGEERFISIKEQDQATAWQQELDRAAAAGDWGRMLRLMRKRPESEPAFGIALLRAIAYHQLGSLEAALAFAEYAHKLEPSDRRSLFLEMRVLQEMGSAAEALQRARAARYEHHDDLLWLLEYYVLLDGFAEQTSDADWHRLSDFLGRRLADTSSLQGLDPVVCRMATDVRDEARRRLREVNAFSRSSASAAAESSPRSQGSPAHATGESSVRLAPKIGAYLEQMASRRLAGVG